MANGDSEVSRLVDQLEREHAGEPWHGTSLVGILTGITHQQAAARPLAGAHTIWELVLHITAWKNEVRQRLGGAPAGDPSEGDWPAAASRRRAPTRGARRSTRSRKRTARSSTPSPVFPTRSCSSGPTIRGSTRTIQGTTSSSCRAFSSTTSITRVRLRC